MPSSVALALCLLLIGWLFFQDRELRPMTSGGLWIVLIWVIIVGSRSVTGWTEISSEERTAASYLEGSPFDRNFFLLLMACGAITLMRRRVNLGRFLNANPWFFAFFFYCGISALWSDFAFVSFKRWAKEVGNVIMVLVLLSEEDPVEAVRAVFARYTYCAIPLSITFNKYFPEYSRYFNQWTGEPIYCGVTTEKNSLGLVVFTCGVFLFWDLLYSRASTGPAARRDLYSRFLLMAMVAWLEVKTRSSTSMVCLALGVCVLLFIRKPAVLEKVHYLGTYTLVLLGTGAFVYFTPGLFAAVVAQLGRDTTFTGRTDLWADVLKEPINPLLGAGYQSFWLGPGGLHMWDKYYFHPIQAHNGFLETYLSGGFLGVGLLLAMIVYTGSKIKTELLLGTRMGGFFLSFLVAAILYNFTEALIGGLNIVWVLVSIAALHDPYAEEVVASYCRDGEAPGTGGVTPAPGRES